MDELTELLTDAAWSRRPRTAARLYRRALALAEPDSEAHVEASEGLGNALEKVAPKQALAHYREVLERDRDGVHGYVYERLPILAEKREDYGLALEAVRLAVRRRVPTETTFRRRAWRIADAAGAARPFVPYRPLPWRVDERREEMFWYWAELARDRKAWRRAARRYERIRGGRYAEARTRLGHCREKLGDVEGAIAAYRQAVTCYEGARRREGDYAVVWRKPFDRLIVLYERAGELAQAWAMALRTLAVVAKRPPASWWKRAERIAASFDGLRMTSFDTLRLRSGQGLRMTSFDALRLRSGQGLRMTSFDEIKETWSPGMRLPGLPEGRRERVGRFADEVGAFRRDRMPK